MSRGAAFGDWDDDGDVDLLVMNNNDAPNLLRNDTPHENHWVTLRLVGAPSNRDGVGTLVRVEAGGLTRIDEVHDGGSYLSQNDLRLHIGLGEATRIDRLELVWPSGSKQTLENLEVDRLLLIREGAGLLSW